MKRFISFFLCLSLIFTVFGGVSYASQLDNGLEYTKYSTYCKITGYSGTGTDLVIPSHVDGVPVKVIEDGALGDVWSISTFSDGEIGGDMDIEDSIFSNCEDLISIEIPYTVTTIGDNAFSGCYSLETVFYTGNSAQWDKIAIGTDNEMLTDSEIIYVGINQVIKAEISVSDFISSFGDDFECSVTKNGTTVASDKFVGTGMTVTVTHKATSRVYTKTVAVRGDVNGDGAVKGADYMKIKKSISNTDLLSGVYFEAGDVNGDGFIKSADYIRIKSYFAGKYNLYA